MHISAKI